MLGSDYNLVPRAFPLENGRSAKALWTRIKLTAKTTGTKILLVVSVRSLEKRSNQPKYKESKTRSPRTTAKVIQNNVYCFFITIFGLAIPAFFMHQVYRCYWAYVGITILYRWRMSRKKLFKRERRKWLTTQKLERKNNKDMDYNNSSRRFRPWGSRVMALSIKCDSLALQTESRDLKTTLIRFFGNSLLICFSQSSEEWVRALAGWGILWIPRNLWIKEVGCQKSLQTVTFENRADWCLAQQK